MPVAAAPMQHDVAIFWRGRRRKPSSTRWLQDACRVTVVYTEGCCCIPQTRSSGLDPAAITVTGMAWEKPYHPFIRASAAFLSQGPWVNASSKKMVLGAQCDLKTGKTIWQQNKQCSGRTVCLLYQKHLCKEDQCTYTFVSLWDTGPWKYWRGKSIYSVCQQFSCRRLNPQFYWRTSVGYTAMATGNKHSVNSL